MRLETKLFFNEQYKRFGKLEFHDFDEFSSKKLTSINERRNKKITF